MSKKFVFFIVMFHMIISNNFVLSDIIPIKKPSQTMEETNKKLLIDVLKPLAKPIENIETENKKKNLKKKLFKKKRKKIYLSYQRKNP